jgi:hypothetical protein
MVLWVEDENPIQPITFRGMYQPSLPDKICLGLQWVGLELHPQLKGSISPKIWYIEPPINKK